MTLIGVPAQQGTAHPDSLGSCSLQSPEPRGVAQGRADHMLVRFLLFPFFLAFVCLCTCVSTRVEVRGQCQLYCPPGFIFETESDKPGA